MRKRICLLAVVGMTCLSMTNAFASDLESVQYDSITELVTLKGTATGKAMAVVVPFGTGLNELSEDNLPVGFSVFDGFGEYTYSFGLPKNSPKGKYEVYLTDDNGMSNQSFMFFNPEEADELVKQLNNIKKLDEYKNFIISNADALGVDISNERYVNNKDEAFNILFNLNKVFTGGGDFHLNFNQCLNIADLKGKNSSEIENILKTEADSLGINYKQDYETLSGEQKKSLCTILSKINYLDEYDYLVKSTSGNIEFVDAFNSLKTLAKVDASITFTEMNNIYNEYLSSILNSNKDYSSKNAKSVFSKMINMKFENLKSLKDNFDNAVKEAINEKSQSGGSAGTAGSSGSSGHSAGGLSIGVSNKSTTTQNNDFDKIPVQTKDGDTTQKSFEIPTFYNEATCDFSDVGTDHWAYKAISALYANNFINGYEDNTFRGNNSITRAEFTKMIVSVFSITGSAENKFSDINEDDWYASPICIASDNGIVNGSDGKFNPDNKIKREDAIVIAYRSAAAVGVTYSGAHNFGDIYDASLYAWPAIESLGANGIVTGNENNFVNPKKEISRFEAAQLIYKLASDIAEKK